MALWIFHKGDLSKGEHKVINNALCKRQISVFLSNTEVARCKLWKLCLLITYCYVHAFLFLLPVSNKDNFTWRILCKHGPTVTGSVQPFQFPFLGRWLGYGTVIFKQKKNVDVCLSVKLQKGIDLLKKFRSGNMLNLCREMVQKAAT